MWVGVVPVAEAGQVAVGAGLSGVLRGRLTVHLEDAAPGLPIMPRRRWMLLTWTARARSPGGTGRRPAARSRRSRSRGAEYARGLADLLRRHAADLGGPLGRCSRHVSAACRSRRCGRRCTSRSIQPLAISSCRMRVEQGDVGARPDRAGGRSASQAAGVGRGSTTISRGGLRRRPIQHPHPEHALRLRDVVADEQERVGRIDVGVASRVAVGAERLLERGRGGGGAEPGVAVHVRRADAGLPDDGQRVVLLEKQLSRGVKADRDGPLSAS